MVKAPPRVVAVVTADVVGSSKYSASDRRHLDRVLRASFREMDRRFRRFLLFKPTFRITAGDEFQFVVNEALQGFRLVVYLRSLAAVSKLRPLVSVRAGIGVGTIAVKGQGGPYEADGAAFQNARVALEAAVGTRGARRWTSVVTGIHDTDATLQVILLLTDQIQQDWTVPQWEAVRWSLLGYKREWIGKRLGIAHQNVTKRLSAARWPYFEQALEYLESLLATTRTRDRVQLGSAPSSGRGEP